MFGLPVETALVILGFPLFWGGYTAVFLWRTRHWKRADSKSEGLER